MSKTISRISIEGLKAGGLKDGDISRLMKIEKKLQLNQKKIRLTKLGGKRYA